MRESGDVMVAVGYEFGRYSSAVSASDSMRPRSTRLSSGGSHGDLRDHGDGAGGPRERLRALHARTAHTRSTRHGALFFRELRAVPTGALSDPLPGAKRSEEHTSE